jgi:cell division septum initiation protein DivIVA
LAEVTGAGPVPFPNDREELVPRVRRLEEDLAQYLAETEGFRKLLLNATSYATRVREDARREAEVVLHKARARADTMLNGVERERARATREREQAERERDRATREREQAEREREQAERELVRLRSLTTETRARLSAFLTTALEHLRLGDEAAGGSEAGAGLTDALGDFLQRNLGKEEWPISSPPVPAENPEP